MAEDVEKVNPALAPRDEQGKPYTVRYGAVNAMLLNEFLKEHEKTEKVGSDGGRSHRNRERTGCTNPESESAQLEASKPPPQVVNNP